MNEVEKVIAHFKSINCGNEKCISCEYNKIAISALEKQIPKKVETDSFYYLCPSCKRDIMDCLKEPKYCLFCGQAFDWSGTK